MNKRRWTTFLTAFIFATLLLSACSSNNEEGKQEKKKSDEKQERKVFNPKPNPDAEQVSSYDESYLKEQEKQDEALKEEYEKDTYDLQKPYVKVNPYGRTPLTALLKFETKAPMEIEVITGSGKDEVPIKKRWKGYKTSHELSVLGLYPDKDNKVTVNAYGKDGKKESSIVSIQTEPAAKKIPQTELVKAKPEQMENGLTFIVPGKNTLYAVDEKADVRWYADMDYRLIFNRLKNGNIVVNTRGNENDQYTDLLEMDMLGKVANAYKIHNEKYEEGNLLHHDVIELPSGNLLATTHDPDGKYVEDHMIEIDRKTGKTVQEIDLKDLFPKDAYEKYKGEYAEKNDWFHQNAVWFDDTDNTILISGRHQDAIMKLSYPDAKIKWILAADEGWPDDYKKYLLKPTDGEVKFPAAQHAVKVMPDMDNNADTTDVLLFDNNHVITRGNKDISNDYSRIVQYQVNEKDKTVKEVWSYGEKRGEAFYSNIVGNAQYLPDTGNRLVSSGHIAPRRGSKEREAIVVETNDRKNADVVYEIKITGFNEEEGALTYRAVRLPLYP